METIDLKSYWEKVSRFSQYPEDKRADGYALGLLAEAGEVCGVVDKWLRNKYDEDEMKRRLVDELGDVCWYLTAVLSLEGSLDTANEITPSYSDVEVYGIAWVVRELSELTNQVCAEQWRDGANVDYYVLRALRWVATLAAYCDTTLQAVLDANVAKLTARHGGPDAQP